MRRRNPTSGTNHLVEDEEGSAGDADLAVLGVVELLGVNDGAIVVGQVVVVTRLAEGIILAVGAGGTNWVLVVLESHDTAMLREAELRTVDHETKDMFWKECTRASYRSYRLAKDPPCRKHADRVPMPMWQDLCRDSGAIVGIGDARSGKSKLLPLRESAVGSAKRGENRDWHLVTVARLRGGCIYFPPST